MVLGRKFIIWFISFVVVLGAFLLYRGANDAGVIELTSLNFQSDANDSNMFADANAGQIGQAKLRGLRQAHFDTVDKKTGKLKRTVGFEKVLHTSGDMWELEKPYMNIFQGKLRCDITSDTGTIEIENAEGAEPMPKSAVLKNNVIIHIMPKTTPSMSDCFIYLNEVMFDSDRSMFYSDNDVNFISADAHLLGKGLEIMYNSITNRLEYLKITKLEYLNITNVEDVKKLSETKTGKKAEKKTAVTAVSPPAQSQSAKKKDENYKCLFQNQATLEYQNEIVLADEISIINLIWSSGDEEKSRPQSEPNEEIASANLPAVQAEVNAPPQPDPAELQKKIMSEFQKRSVVAVIKCKGSMIIKPESSTRNDDYKYAKFVTFNQLPADVRQMLGKRNVLLSQRVGYDYINQIAKAYDDVEIAAYPKTETDGIGEKPFFISAKKGAEFLARSNQAVFYGNVKGVFSKQADYYNEENTFYGDKLVVDLVSSDKTEQPKSKSAPVMSANVSHIAVTGPGVRLESARTAGEKKLSHIRLKSKRIDYDKITENVIASGAGQIEYAREEQLEKKQVSSQLSGDKPCYAIIRGFDKLTWDTNSMHVRATSDKTGGIHIGYVPFTMDENRQKVYGRKITVETKQVDIDYIEPVKGKSQIDQFFATGGVVFTEQDRWEFAGKGLSKYAKDDFLTIWGSEDMPCMFNGAFVDKIEYNLQTNSASGVMGKEPGVIPVR